MLTIIGADDVRRLLPMEECIAVMADVLARLERNQAFCPLRTAVWLPDRSGLLGLMPACLASPPVMGAKVVSVVPGNQGTPYETHQGLVLLFEGERGRLVAAVEAGSITALRTAAVSGLATRLLAREEASDLAILGSGTQASSHLEAMRAVRRLRRVRVWSRNPDHARRFAERESARWGLRVEVVASARDAVERADIVCTTTAASEPVLKGAWLSPGAHVNAVGACLPTARELDSEAVRRARLFVDRRESAFAESGDFLGARREGAIGDEHIVAEIGEVVVGKAPGRTGAGEITLFESVGLAVEDLAAALHVWRKAAAAGAGSRLAIGGERHEA